MATKEEEEVDREKEEGNVYAILAGVRERRIEHNDFDSR